MLSTSCEAVTYCVPSEPCTNTLCPRHRSNAPTDQTGVSVADFWPMCVEKRVMPLPFPVYNAGLSAAT